MKMKRTLLPFALLIAASLACNLLSRTSTQPNAPSEEAVPSEETATPAPPAPTATTAPTPFEPASGEPYDLDNSASALEDPPYNTYRASLLYSFRSTDGVTGTLTMESATQSEPYATSLFFDTAGAALDSLGNDFTYVLLDNIEYIASPGIGCQGGVTNFQLTPFERTLDTGEVLTGQAQYVGEETVNGVDTLVYSLTTDNLKTGDPAELGIETLTEGQVFIAREGGFPVRVILSGTGTNEGLSGDPNLQGALRYELNYFDFDQPVEISVPEGCADTNDPTQDLPLPDDASGVTRFVDFVSFTTARTMDELVTFYEDQMPGFGCTPPEVIGDGTSMTSMTFSGCSFGSAQIVMTAETNGGTSATIFIMPE